MTGAGSSKRDAATSAAGVAITDAPNPAAWDTYVAAHPEASAYHPWCWRGVFERAFGHETVYLAATRGTRLSGVLPLVSFRSLIFGRFLVSLPFVNYGGVLADDDGVARALMEAARDEAVRRRAASIELRHLMRRFPDLPVRQHKVAMTMALASDEASAWTGLDNKVRNQIRKAQKSGLEPVVGRMPLLAEFYRVFARNMRDLGTPVYSPRFFEQVLASVPDARVYVVRRDRLAVAAGITIGHRTSIENPWASSLREHRSANPNMLLYWTMLGDAIARGYRTFDFGRSTPDEGTYHFKRQWGAVAAPCYWEYVLNGTAALPDRSPKSGRFSLAVSAWQRLPLAVANLLGPAIVRNIP